MSQDNVLGTSENPQDVDLNRNKVVTARNAVIVLVIAVSLVGLYFISNYSYPLFHSIVEVFSLVIAFSIFAIAWNTRHIVDNRYFLFVGIAFLFVAVLGLFHALTYKGMGVFPNLTDPNWATQLWIAARYLLSISFLLPLLFIKREVKPRIIFAGYSIVTALLLLSIFVWQNFPLAYNLSTESLTDFKIASEFIISLIIVLTIGLLIKKRTEFSKDIYRILLAAMVLGIATDMAFTLYTDVYGIANMVGHLLNLLSFYFIYRALIETSLTRPFELLFRNLKQSETNRANRASELSMVNKKLEEEIAQREAIQSELEEKAIEVKEYASQMEALAEERAKQLKDAERLSAIGATAGMVGHDIRNPLQAITSELYLQNKELESLPNSEAKNNLEEGTRNIEENVLYINKIVADLQDFAKPLNPKRENVDVEKTIHEALAMVKFPQKIKLTISGPQKSPTLIADSTMLKRVLVNLTQNAVQAMPNGGNLTVAIDRRMDQVQISVADTGEGIPKDVQPKLFTPLMTTKAKGQGFGLPVVKRMTEAMCGTVDFESEEGKGTKFILRFPA